MRLPSICVFVMLSLSSAYAASEEFPVKVRGSWTDSKETCDALGTTDPGFLREDKKWLKVTGTSVLGSVQGRFFRGVPAQTINGAPAELSFELQPLDESGRIILLSLSIDGRLHETRSGTVFLPCSSTLAESVEFPERMRGFWVDKKSTCDVLRAKGPAYLREDQRWIKIAATDVLGSSQGRLLQQRRFAQLVDRTPAELSFEVQMLENPGRPADLVDMTFSFDGRLYETIVGARASGIYQRCPPVLSGKNP